MGINLLRELGYDDESAAVRNARAAAFVYAEAIDSLADTQTNPDGGYNT